jgi:hypothetical protein
MFELVSPIISSPEGESVLIGAIADRLGLQRRRIVQAGRNYFQGPHCFLKEHMAKGREHADHSQHQSISSLASECNTRYNT